jgi:GGDEF domain-containing protein
MYGDRLTRLPRRLGFETTPEGLDESRQVLEAELAEYTEATSAWLDAGSNLAREIVAIVAGLDQAGTESESLHAAMLGELAEQMTVSAEVDAASDLRAALRRYATGLRSYLQCRRLESSSSLKDLQGRAEQLAEWLARADPSHSTDLVTGLPNRSETERQLEASWYGGSPVSVLVFEWEEVNPATAEGVNDAVAKQLADRLGDLVRPRDIVGRWAPKEFVVIFSCPGETALPRASSIAKWLTAGYSYEVEGAVVTTHVRVTVAVIERLPEETLAHLVERIEQVRPGETAVLRNT